VNGAAGMLTAIRAWTRDVDAIVSKASPTTAAAFNDFHNQPLPEDASGDIQGLADSLAEADARAAEAASKAADAIAPGLQTARAKMVEALSSIAPEAVLHLWQTPEQAAQFDDSDPSRFAWLLATPGRGFGAALSDWNRYAEVSELWLGEFMAASRLIVVSLPHDDRAGVGDAE
jgi:hypothetical protein